MRHLVVKELVGCLSWCQSASVILSLTGTPIRAHDTTSPWLASRDTSSPNPRCQGTVPMDAWLWGLWKLNSRERDTWWSPRIFSLTWAREHCPGRLLILPILVGSVWKNVIQKLSLLRVRRRVKKCTVEFMPGGEGGWPGSCRIIHLAWCEQESSVSANYYMKEKTFLSLRFVNKLPPVMQDKEGRKEVIGHQTRIVNW